MNNPILLGHQDVLLRLERSGDPLGFLEGDGEGHLDLPRALQGGIGGGFFACWVPRYLHDLDPDEETVYEEEGYVTSLAGPLDPEYAQDVTVSMVQTLYQVQEYSRGRLRIVRDLAELVGCLQEDVFAAILHFEGAEAIDPSLHSLESYYEAGLRSLGLVWSRPNSFGHGVQFRFPSSPDTGPGLTGAGRELVRACNDLGIMLDVSHLTEEGFWDVARLSRAPLVASHSNAQSLCPSSRNLTDDQLQAIAASGGVVGLNFCVSDLRPDGDTDPQTPLELLFQQVEYIAESIGLDHVAVGSDYDGAVVPEEIGDASLAYKLLEGLEERGFSEGDLEKIAHGNWLRVLEQTWH